MLEDAKSVPATDVLARSVGDAALSVLGASGGTPRCDASTREGMRCRMRPLRGARHCWSHDPDHVAEATKARALGGQRRRREHLTARAYNVQGVQTVAEIRRVLEIAIIDTLNLESSVARSRALFWGCAVLLKLREVGELEGRLEAIEAALRLPRKREENGDE